jgi:hypothetical protein
MKKFKGADWNIYVRLRNQERKDESDAKRIDEYDGPLLDDIEEVA